MGRGGPHVQSQGLLGKNGCWRMESRPWLKSPAEGTRSLWSWDGKVPSQVRPGAQPFEQRGHCSTAGPEGADREELVGAVAGGRGARLCFLRSPLAPDLRRPSAAARPTQQ